jgi:hypothetical protein
MKKIKDKHFFIKIILREVKYYLRFGFLFFYFFILKVPKESVIIFFFFLKFNFKKLSGARQLTTSMIKVVSNITDLCPWIDKKAPPL